MISPLAFVSPGARLGEHVTVHPFAYIEGDVVIGDNCTVMPHASILEGTRMGRDNRVFQGAVLGAVPQDFCFTGDKTTLEIGDNNVFRENVVVNRATRSGSSTRIGSNNFIFEGVHISHDTQVADSCVLGNGTKIAGNCSIDSHTIFSTMVIMDQGARVGSWAMIQGGCHFNKDIPPFVVAARNPVGYYGINAKVMAHEGFSEQAIEQIAQAYGLIYQCNVSVVDALMKIREQMLVTPDIDAIIRFIQGSKRGIVGTR
ncbi:MAG: acyl-ACP--UDP-N-acetylglucosamine O-acyltransferase [Rikenellaceae bacterium]|nr:acyl-ACP--UDP-N-acetylglucosamine O-acyltransferase [Rikenellaceae bacterium]